MTDALRTALDAALHRRDLTAEQMHAAVSAIMAGEAGDIEIAALLTALRMKGETTGELVGAARAMSERATPIPVRRTGLLDTCGTGGDGLHTFNISTAAALVVAAAGVPVAKHGNRRASSTCGSADVLEELGVNLELSPEQVARSVEEIGIGFCFAPLLHGAMKFAAPVRKALGFRTIFNMLGPLTNPARAEYQLVGTPDPDMARKLADALAQLGRRRAIVVCGAGQLDEVSLWGETTAFVVENTAVTPRTWTAATFGLPECHPDDLRVSSPAESAAVIRRILADEPGPPRNIVVANAAAALLAAGHATDARLAAEQAAHTLTTGDARQLCEKLVTFSRSAATA